MPADALKTTSTCPACSGPAKALKFVNGLVGSASYTLDHFRIECSACRLHVGAPTLETAEAGWAAVAKVWKGRRAN